MGKISIVDKQLRFRYNGTTHKYVGEKVGNTIGRKKSVRINGNQLEYIDEYGHIRRIPHISPGNPTEFSNEVIIENALIKYVDGGYDEYKVS